MGAIELRGFGILQKVLADKGYSFPANIEIKGSITGYQLLELLEMSGSQVEAIFVNGTVERLSYTISPGNRVALLPPGTPGPYRVFLGIVQKKET